MQDRKPELWNAKFVIIGGTAGCHNENMWHRQWRQMWHNGDARFGEIL